MRGRRGNGEGSIQQRADGRWCGIASSPAGKREFVYGRTRAEASDRLRELQATHQQGLPTPNQRLSTADFLRDWLMKTRVRPRTQQRYESVVRVHLIPAIGRVPLAKVEPGHLEALYAARLASGLSPRSVHHIHMVLHRAFRMATRWGLLSRNVVELVDPPRVERGEIHVLNPEQARLFLSAAEGHDHEALFVLAISTGMRQGEILGLRWRDIDLDRRTLSVTQTLERAGREPVFGEPKTRSSRRRIDLTDRVVVALRAHRARQAKDMLEAEPGVWHDLDLIFTNRCGRPVDPHRLGGPCLGSLLESAGLPRLRFHDLRHTAATLLLSKGVHPKVVADLLGHASISITLDTYSHVLVGMQEHAVAAMNEALG